MDDDNLLLMVFKKYQNREGGTHWLMSVVLFQCVHCPCIPFSSLPNNVNVASSHLNFSQNVQKCAVSSFPTRNYLLAFMRSVFQMRKILDVSIPAPAYISHFTFKFLAIFFSCVPHPILWSVYFFLFFVFFCSFQHRPITYIRMYTIYISLNVFNAIKIPKHVV